MFLAFSCLSIDHPYESVPVMGASAVALIWAKLPPSYVLNDVISAA